MKINILILVVLPFYSLIGMDLLNHDYALAARGLALAECNAQQADAQSKQSFTIADFNWETDGEQVIEIMKKNWSTCAVGSEYDHATVLHIFKDGKSVNRNGWGASIKVLKDNNNNKVGGFIVYVGYQCWPAAGGGQYDIFAMNSDRTPVINIGHIELVAVDEAYRRSGLASMLIRHATDDLKKMGAKNVNIYVEDDNKPALRCYQKLGFVADPNRTPQANVTFLDKSLQERSRLEAMRSRISDSCGRATSALSGYLSKIKQMFAKEAATDLRVCKLKPERCPPFV
jgi:ribosomal protein S18 acetylase RimI-like enzyme